MLSSRRNLLRFIASSPLFAGTGLFGSLLDSAWPESVQSAAAQAEELITAPDQAVNIMDFEAVARRELPPAHYGYLATGVDGDATVRVNSEGFSRFQIRSRRLVNVGRLDTSIRLFGQSWNTPIVLAPVSSQKAFHPDGEAAAARAARAKEHLQMLSTVASCSVEEVTEARGAPVWQQLYPTDVWEVTRAIIKRAEAAGSPALVLTVDLYDDSNRETLFRARRADKRDCNSCHDGRQWRSKPMFDGLDMSQTKQLMPSSMTWDFVKRLKDATRLRLLLKGIVTREDAELALRHGADGIVVSNHGGRAEETLRSTIECLPEVVQGVGGKVPVLIDGGFRRGTDVFKALALGATAVCIGRPYVWGVAAFGQPGVEAVLDILVRELRTIMRQAGTATVKEISRAYVLPRG